MLSASIACTQENRAGLDGLMTVLYFKSDLPAERKFGGDACGWLLVFLMGGFASGCVCDGWVRCRTGNLRGVELSVELGL